MHTAPAGTLAVYCRRTSNRLTAVSTIREKTHERKREKNREKNREKTELSNLRFGTLEPSYWCVVCHSSLSPRVPVRAQTTPRLGPTGVCGDVLRSHRRLRRLRHLRRLIMRRLGLGVRDADDGRRLICRCRSHGGLRGRGGFYRGLGGGGRDGRWRVHVVPKVIPECVYNGGIKRRVVRRITYCIAAPSCTSLHHSFILSTYHITVLARYMCVSGSVSQRLSQVTFCQRQHLITEAQPHPSPPSPPLRLSPRTSP